MSYNTKESDRLVNEQFDVYVVSHDGDILFITQSLEEATNFAVHCEESPTTVSAAWVLIEDAEEFETYERRHEQR